MNNSAAALLWCLVGLLLVGVAAGGAAAAPGRATADSALPLPIAWPAAFSDTVVGPDYVDLWTVSLGAGQQVIADMTPVEGDDEIGVSLWAPGTTDFSDPYDSTLVHDMRYFTGSASYKYIVPAGATGTYYIGVWSDEYSAGADGPYRMWVSVQSPSKTAVRISPPAVRARLRTNRDYVSWGTLRPLHYAGDETVKVEWQKFYQGRWRRAGTDRPENRDSYDGTTRYTRFRLAYSFWGIGSGTLRWRVRAIHLADGLHPRKASAWRYFKVSN